MALGEIWNLDQAIVDESNHQNDKQIYNRKSIQRAADFPFRRPDGDENRECAEKQHVAVCQERSSDSLSIIDQRRDERQEDAGHEPPERLHPWKVVPNMLPSVEREKDEQGDQVKCVTAVHT